MRRHVGRRIGKRLSGVFRRTFGDGEPLIAAVLWAGATAGTGSPQATPSTMTRNTRLKRRWWPKTSTRPLDRHQQ